MKERIILAPGVSGTELLRTLAKYGRNTIGLRVTSGVELAKLALMNSGVSVTGAYLTGSEIPSVICSFLDEIPYFQTASYQDAEHLSVALYNVRSLIPKAEREKLQEHLSRGEFPDKNRALIAVYERYQKEKEEKGKLDGIDLMRMAIAQAEPLGDRYDLICLREYPLSPLEAYMLQLLSGENVQRKTMIELFGRQEKKLSPFPITEGYGEINEACSILDDIYGSGKKPDTCLIACAGTSYAQVLYDLSMLHEIPMTFGTGIPIINSNPAVLLKLLSEWDGSGYHGVDALKAILTSDSLDQRKLAGAIGSGESLSLKEREEISVATGNLRLSFDPESNQKKLQQLCLYQGESELAEKIEKLAGQLELGYAKFIRKYSRVREGKAGSIDESAIQVITETIDAFTANAPGHNVNEIIPALLSKTVCRENSKEGAIHVTTIASAAETIRQHLFICGMGAANFPGSPTENYLILDNDYRSIPVEEEETLPTSGHIIEKRKQALDNLVRLASSLDVDLHMSFSGYSLTELKGQNPSSSLYNLYKKIQPEIAMDEFREGIIKASYFSSRIDADRLVRSEYSLGQKIDFKRYKKEKLSPEDVLNRPWSPSVLEIYGQCPRRFYLTKILRIPEEESDDPFQVIDAATLGTLAHAQMEKLAEKPLQKAEFLQEAGNAFDRFLAERPPIHEADARFEKQEFLDMMETAYDIDPHYEVLASEKRYEFTHPEGIKLCGYPDRVERTDRGDLIIVDFKTKRKVEHIPNDFQTCLQVILYAWMCEQAGIDISGAEYRYLRMGQVVTCEYNDMMREKLREFLAEFKKSVKENHFPRNCRDDHCKYCTMGDICDWESIESEKTIWL